MSESELLRRVMLRCSELGARVFRNNVGMLEDRFGNKLRYGVCNPGGSDLIGWTKEGRFIAIETKVWPRKPTKHQQQFLDAVKAAGGIALLVYRVEDVVI